MKLKSIILKSLPKKIQQDLHRKKLFEKGYKTFSETGITPEESYMAYIDLYCHSNGKFSDSFHNKIKGNNPSKEISPTMEGITGEYNSSEFKKVNNELNQKGYYHFEKKISKVLCQKLYDYALKTPAGIPPDYKTRVTFKPGDPVAEIYRIDAQDLINNLEVQELIMDPVFINIARNYLGCEPIFDFPALWWTTSLKKEASHEAAQLFHFDLDRIKWLKLFIYINDVNEDNGPHSYIEGTHKANSKPSEILKRGYARIPDEDLKPFYDNGKIKVVCGDAGSVFMGDTKCWHKGTNLKSGHRLAFELEYTSSLFGVNYPKLKVKNYSKLFKDFCEKNKVFASNFNFEN